MKIYSGIDKLPRGKAPEGYTEGCLALEGGGFRGVYTAGVIDFLMEKGINFRTTVGVSAGALNGVSYGAGAIGRSALCNLKYRHDKRWVGFDAIKSNKGIMGYEFLKNEFEKEYPLDKERLMNPDHRVVAVATNVKTGKPEYFDSSKLDFDTFFKAVEASATMPFVSKVVKIGNKGYLDGGCATKLPIEWAFEEGFEKIVFVATRDASYRRQEKTKQSPLLKHIYGPAPKFREAYTFANTRYNENCDLIDKLVEEGRIFRIAPSEKVTVSRLEGDMEKLGALYYLGYNDAAAQYDALMEYLKK